MLIITEFSGKRGKDSWKLTLHPGTGKEEGTLLHSESPLSSQCLFLVSDQASLWALRLLCFSTPRVTPDPSRALTGAFSLVPTWEVTVACHHAVGK